MNFDEYKEEFSFDELNELKNLIKTGGFNNINLNDVNTLSYLHECLIESNNLSNILNSLFNSVKDIDVELNNISSLSSYVSSFKNDLQDICEYQDNVFNEINKLFFNN